MAAAKAPKHDFAPAWLKIPESEPTGTPSRDRASVRPYSRFDDSNFPSPSFSGTAPIHRQRSHDNFLDHRSPSGKFRHQSADGYSEPHYYSYGPPYRPAPSSHRDRPGRFSSSSSDWKSYNENYYENRDYFDSFQQGNKRHRSTSKNSRDRLRDGAEEADGSYRLSELPAVERRGDRRHRRETPEVVKSQEEFPSLNGDSEKEPKSTRSALPANNVWGERSLTTRIQKNDESRRGKENGFRDLAVLSTKKNSDSLYRAQVTPRKANLDVTKLKSTNEKSAPKELPAGSPPLGDDDLPRAGVVNAVVTPKRKSNNWKKSDFLKALRKSNDDDEISLPRVNGYLENEHDVAYDHDVRKNGDGEKLTNGLENDDAHLGILSSSLEAERRLLMSMGWQEDADDGYTITEEDMELVKNKMAQAGLADRTNGQTLDKREAAQQQQEMTSEEPLLASEDSDSDTAW